MNSLISRPIRRMFWMIAGIGIALAALAAVVIGLSGGTSNATADDAQATAPPTVSIFDDTTATPPAGRLAELDKTFEQVQNKPAQGTIRNVHLSNGADVTVYRSTNGAYCLLVTSPAPERSGTAGCGTLDDIAKGRFTVAGKDPGTGDGYLVAGIAPDGVEAVDLTAGTEGTATARAAVSSADLAVRDNVFGEIVPAKPATVGWTTAGGAQVSKTFTP